MSAYLFTEIPSEKFQWVKTQNGKEKKAMTRDYDKQSKQRRKRKKRDEIVGQSLNGVVPFENDASTLSLE